MARPKARNGGDVVVLASGGLDSSVLVAHLVRQGATVYPLFLKGGLVWEKAELACLERFLEALPSRIARAVRPLKVAGLPMDDIYGEHWSTTGLGVPEWSAPDESVYLPGRNLAMLVKAAVHASLLGVGRVAIGVLKGNPFPDATPGFFRALERALAGGLGAPMALEAPFLHLDKVEVIRMAADLPIHLTFSCSNPSDSEACGACAKCRERILALGSAAVASGSLLEDSPK